MKNKIIYITYLAITLWITSCKHGDPPQNPASLPVPVNLLEVSKQHLVYYDSYPASVVAQKEVELRCEVGGDVTGIFFNEGQQVRQGQKLYEIDRSRYQASYQQAKANLDIANSNMERAQRNADRYVELGKEDAIAKQRLDNALTDLQNARSQIVSAKADLVKAETELNYSVIAAPFDGTIGISMVRMGALVTPDQTLLNVVSSDNPMGVDFVVDEKELGRFEQLEKKPINKNDSTFRLLMPDNTVYPFYGRLSIIDRAVDPQTGTIKIRLSFPNTERNLKPGMNCNVQVLNENSGWQVVVPYRAVVEQMSEFFVFKRDSSKVRQVKISLGAKIGSNVIIRKGINAGDFIVIDGIQRLHDGSAILVGSRKIADNNKAK